MKTALENLQKARSKYVALSKEAEQSEQIHAKGKGDMNMKPAQLAKLAAKSSQAAEKAAQADNEYQQTLAATNQKQHEIYITTMPAVLQEFQQFEEDRVKFMKQMGEMFTQYNGEKPSVYSTACQNLIASVQSISVDADIQAFLSENRTGVTVPPNIEYIPYDNEIPAVLSNSSKKPEKLKSKPPSSSKLSKYKSAEDFDLVSSKQWGLSESDQNLSVDEQQTILSGQLEELAKAISSETKTKEGLENLVRFYTSDPVAQKKAEEQLQESESKLKRLNETKITVQAQAEQLASGVGVQYSKTSNGGSVSIKVRGLYDYTATCETELSFREGDLLMVTEQDDSGWWYAELNGQCGFVPNNYVRVQ